MTKLPEWAVRFNESGRAERARKESGIAKGSFYEEVGRSPASVSYQLDFAKALILGEKLGQNPLGATDMITTSVSSTDINGHAFAPDNPSQKSPIVKSDALLDAFLTFDDAVGLKNVMIAMTGDHGVAASQKSADSMGMPALDFPPAQFTKPLEAMLEETYPPKERTPISYR